jgi:hypothetical protein
VKFTLDELLKTRAGQQPSNRALIEEAIQKHGPKADILTLGAVRAPELQPNEVPALVGKSQIHEADKRGLVVCVTIIRFGHKLFDEDNLVAGAKPLRDAVATSLGVDDADPRILWQYAQVTTGGRFGTLVKIDEL